MTEDSKDRREPGPPEAGAFRPGEAHTPGYGPQGAQHPTAQFPPQHPPAAPFPGYPASFAPPNDATQPHGPAFGAPPAPDRRPFRAGLAA
ncbi:hypothetical protein ABZ507_22270, partial [Nocardia niwae]